MQTPNSMSDDKLDETLESIFKAMILKYVKLDFYDMNDEKMRDIILSCPTFGVENRRIYGVPYILSHDGNKFYITYEHLRKYDLKQSELIYHARQNTLKIIDQLFKCDAEVTEKMPDVGFVTHGESQIIDINSLNRMLKNETKY